VCRALLRTLPGGGVLRARSHASYGRAMIDQGRLDDDARSVLTEINNVGPRPTADLHADTAMHARPFDDALDHPRLPMRVWTAAAKLVYPDLFRHLTRATLDTWGRGVQVFSTTHEGFPPFFRGSHRFYTQAVAGWPKHANDTPLNAFMFQAGFVYREVARHSDRLRLARTYAETVQAINDGCIAVHLAIEGAAPLLPRADNEAALQRWLASPSCRLPAAMPLPTAEELGSRRGLVAYAARLGVLYVSLSHLNSNALCGSDMPGARRRGAGLGRDTSALFAELQQHGILLDLAHASRASQAEACGQATLPVLVSHTLIVDPARPRRGRAWRALADATLDEVARTGGVVGVMFAKRYLPRGRLADIVDQIDYLKRRIGIEFVAIGSDADGFVELAIGNLGRVGEIIEELGRRGYSAREIEHVRFANLLRVLRRRDALLAGAA